MKTKFITLFAFVLVMGAFLLSVSAFAATNAAADTAPPTVKASITGNNLSIQATDADSGVEAIYIDGKRFNYRVDSILNADVRDVADDGATISVYAVDFAGNQSSVVTINNPLYVEPTTAPTSSPAPTSFPITSPATSQPSTSTSSAAQPSASSSAQTNPFTPSGQASVVDQANQSDGKDFYTFTTPDGNVFYLIIDHQKNGDNVYFLNAVNEDDLAALADKSKNGSTSSVPIVSQPTTQPTTSPATTSDPAASTTTTPAKSGGGNSGMMIFLVIAVLGVGGAAYYFKIVKPKQQAANNPDDGDENEDDGEEMEFEDEPDDSGESEPDDGETEEAPAPEDEE